MSDEVQAKAEKKKSSGKFFAIDKNQWPGVCALGINAATAYLVMACGASGKDHSTTKWSARSIVKRTQLPFNPTRAAIESLKARGLVQQTVDGQYPQYKISLSSKPEWIWLPNTIITGVCGKLSPVKQLLMTDNVSALRLFVELYSVHDLENEGGVNRQAIYQEYSRRKIGDYAEYSLWQFSSEENSTACSSIAEPYFDQAWYRELRKAKRNSAAEEKACHEMYKPFWHALKIIEDLHLIEWVPYLCCGASNVVMHPYGLGPVEIKGDKAAAIENKIGYAAHRAAVAMGACIKIRNGQNREAVIQFARTDQEQVYRATSPMAPVRRHIENVQMIGIARLKFRPLTKPTRAWYGQLMEEGPGWIDDYKRARDKALVELELKDHESAENSDPEILVATGT